jgi:hypothetical protein
MLPPVTSPWEPIPHPNGYIDLIAAANAIQGDPPDLKTSTVETIQGFIASNRTALNNARASLSLPYCVPVNGSKAFNARHNNDLSAGKQIALAMAEEGRLADLQNNPAAAATNYLAVTKLGIDLERGGVLIDMLVAIACESIGTTRLKEEIPKLTAQQSAAFARELEQLEAGREPIEKILENEDAFQRSQEQHGFIRAFIERVIERRMLLNIRQKAVSNYNQYRQQTLKMEMKLAAHAFELEKGSPPKSWNDLIPAYLQRIPLDLGTTNQLTFSPR